MFQPDDFVVYPAQGVGKIESLDLQEIGGVTCEFYIVRILANNITLMVPVHNATHVGLRMLCSEAQAQEILDLLLSSAVETVYTGQNWNRRYREYSEKLKSVFLVDVAVVVRELLLISRAKELSFGERRLLEQAMGLVCGELAVVLHKPEGELRQHVQTVYTPPAQDVK